MDFKLINTDNIKEAIDSFIKINTGMTIHSRRKELGLIQENIETDEHKFIDSKVISQIENLKTKGKRNPSFITDANLLDILHSNLNFDSKFNLIFGNRLKNLEILQIVFISLINEIKLEINNSFSQKDQFEQKPFYKIYSSLLSLIPSEAINLSFVDIHSPNNTRKNIFINRLDHYQIDRETLKIIKLSLGDISMHNIFDDTDATNLLLLNFFVNLFGWDFYELLKIEFSDDDSYEMRNISNKFVKFLENTFFPYIYDKLSNLNDSPLSSNGKDIKNIINEINKIMDLLDLYEEDTDQNTLDSEENKQQSLKLLLFKLNMLSDNLRNYLLIESPFSYEYFQKNFYYIQLMSNVKNPDLMIDHKYQNIEKKTDAILDWEEILKDIDNLNLLEIDLNKASKTLKNFIRK